MCLEGASRGHKTLIIVRRNASTANERCCTLLRCMMNEFSELALSVSIDHSINLDTNKTSRL